MVIKKPDSFSSILLTLSYCDQFDYPLSYQQIFPRLITDQVPFHLINIKQSLNKLTKLGLIEHQDDFWFLKNRQKIISIRQKRAKYSLQKNKEISDFIFFASFLPWIKAVFLSGSVAMQNAVKNDDLDFFIITQQNRLWLTRLILMVFTTIGGKRRSWHSEEENSWCLNLYLDQKALNINSTKRNIYTAYEISQVKLLYQNDGVASDFYRQNWWVKKVLPFFQPQVFDQQHNILIELIRFFLSIVDFFFSWLFKSLNFLAYQAQLSYMRPHMTSERVNLHQAFFHPRNTRKKILEYWQKSLLNV